MPLSVTKLLMSNGETVELGAFNALVGPNNCGKSQTLRDVREFVITGSSAKLVVIKGVDIDLPNETEFMQGLRSLPHPSPGHTRIIGVSYDLKSSHEFHPHDNWLKQPLTEKNKSEVLQNFGRFLVAHLDAESRLGLASPTDCYDRRVEAPSNALQAFLAGGPKAQEELRTAFKDAFGMDIALDWAAMRRWYLRIGKSFGDIPNDLDQLNALLNDAPELSAQGDGYRSFAGVVLAMLTFQNRLLLLDEPDAFLHPAQARVLGRWLGKRAQSSATQVILATHNSDFLWGLISSNPDVRVIRLNRAGDVTRYHLIPSMTTENLVKSPLLSSQPVLDSLFQQGVAVCEGDPDRAIYQTVSHQRLATQGGEGILFIHANGKDALKTPVMLLRAAGIPVCAVVDFDIFNSESILSDLYEALAGNRPDVELLDLRRQVAELVEKRREEDLLAVMKEKVEAWQKNTPVELRQARRVLKNIADNASKWDHAKAKGLECLDKTDHPRVENLISLCRTVGIFVVPKGELESWIALGVSKGKQWNRLALEKLHAGDCPPDLHQFVTGIVAYLRKPEPALPGASTAIDVCAV